jgi:hypothetical protein
MWKTTLDLSIAVAFVRSFFWIMKIIKCGCLVERQIKVLYSKHYKIEDCTASKKFPMFFIETDGETIQ